MIIDGRALAQTIITAINEAVTHMPTPPRLTVFTCEPNFETQKFLALKERKAREAGVVLEVVQLPGTVTVSEVEAAIAEAVAVSDGIILQFPFPHLRTEVLSILIPSTHDVDVMQYDGRLEAPLPPVVGAIDSISTAHDVTFAQKSVVVVGNGRLVGAPAALYAASRGGEVTVLTKETFTTEVVQAADILILGAGVPGLITPAMVKEGVVVFDAGTSEEGGVLVGDVDPAVAEKATLFTPVPGGIGPLTVAILLKNVLYCAKSHRK